MTGAAGLFGCFVLGSDANTNRGSWYSHYSLGAVPCDRPAALRRLHTGVFNYATNISANLEVQQLGVAGSERYAVQRLLQVSRPTELTCDATAAVQLPWDRSFVYQ